MNWLKAIKNLLGKFWSLMFQDDDFIRGVENAHALLSKSGQYRLDRWDAESVASSSDTYFDPLPFIIYIRKSSFLDSQGSGEIVSDVHHPAVPMELVLNGDACLGDESDSAGWVCTSLYEIPAPFCISNHSVDYSSILYRGIDYTWDGKNLVFCVNPESLGFDTVALTDDSGILHTYYRAFGWKVPEETINDAVRAFDSNILAGAAANAAWAVHQHGATWFNIKKLLAAVTDSIVCDTAGVVTHVWEEQGRKCLLVNDSHVYYPSQAGIEPEFDHGDNVKSGDILFGGLRMAYADDLSDSESSSDFPGVLVRTDAGELMAMNVRSAVHVDSNGVKTLPLSGDAGKLAEYRYICARNIMQYGCPEIAIPDTVNPMKFICSRLRAGRAALVSIKSNGSQALADALDCVRKNINALGILTVNIKADTTGWKEPAKTILNASAEAFTATAGHAAVATCARLKLQEMFTTAGICI